MFVPHIEGDQVQLLQSNLSLWEGDLSAVLCHHLFIHGVLTSKIRGHGTSPSAGGTVMESRDNSDNAIVTRLLGSL